MLKDFYVIGYFSKPTEFILQSLDSLSEEKHMTVLPQFAMEEEHFPEFAASFSTALSELRKSGANEYSVSSASTDTFSGIGGPVTVQIINKTIEIEELHLNLREIAKSFSASFQNDDYSGAGYTPHVSHAADNFSAQLTHLGITTYQENPFRTEILSLFDLETSTDELSVAA